MLTKNLAPKFLIPISLLIVFTSLVLSIFFVRHETRVVRAERKNYADSLARNLAYNAEYGVITRNSEILNTLITGVMKEKDVISIEITDNKGFLLTTMGQKKEPFYESKSDITTVKMESREGALADIDIDSAFRMETPDKGSQEVIGKVVLRTSLVEMQNKINQIKRRIVEVTLIVIIIAIAITFFLVNKITSPLKDLVLATKKISNGDLGHKVYINTSDEIGELAVSFNKMTEDLSRTLVSKDYVDNIIKSMLDTLIVADPDGTIRTINQATTDLLGYTEGELRGKQVSMLFAKSIFKANDSRVWAKELVQKTNILNVETAYLSKDGREIPIILSGSVMKSEMGLIQGFVFVALDITERKRSEELIRQSEERFRNLVETAPDVIYSLAVTNGNIISLNPAFERTTGFKREEWLGRPFHELIHQDDLPLAMKMFDLIKSGKPQVTFELRVQSKSGEYMIGEFTSAPQFENGQIIAEFGIVRDITERKKMEKERENLTKQLLQSEKMAAVGQLAGGVAHEINNPLGVILGFAQSLLRRIKEDDPLLMPLQSIERESKRCKNLVQDLLTFSRIGKTEKESCDINEVVKSALTLVEAQTKVRSVELIRDFGANIPKLLISRNQIQQVIVNLCNNGIDSMTNNGTLTIKTIGKKIDGRDFVELHIKDTGSGIPKEIQTKIFEPFFTTKEVGKGTGLGLSLVYEIIQKHQGKIELESDVGKGSLFRVILPAEQFSISQG
ncbi:MAG: PAS domain S-box protein [Endomicrobiales bacterium]|nr:PAS domain S-box protein [Endomicrobiales bacterium]